MLPGEVVDNRFALEQITDPARRRGFLEQLPEDARTLQLAEALL